jgi:hypothetical protein
MTRVKKTFLVMPQFDSRSFTSFKMTSAFKGHSERSEESFLLQLMVKTHKTPKRANTGIGADRDSCSQSRQERLAETIANFILTGRKQID